MQRSVFVAVKKTNDRNKSFCEENPYYILMGKDTLLEEIYDEDDMKFWSVCGKMYASCLFDNIRFENGRMYEDVDIVYKLLFEANKVVNCKEVYYHYFSNPDSATKRPYNLKRLDQLWAMERLINFLEYQKNMNSLYCKVIDQYLYLIYYHYKEIEKNQLDNKYMSELKKKMKIYMKQNKRKIHFSIKHYPFCYEVLFPSFMKAYWIIIHMLNKLKTR